MPSLFQTAALACALAALTLPAACNSTPKDKPVAESAELQSHTFQSFDGTTIRYQTLGKGPVVFLLHGFTVNAKINWFDTGIAQKVAAAGYTVVAPDTRGHGGSSNLPGPLAWPEDAAARDQVALADHLGTEPFAVIGYSMGSLVALRYHLLSGQGGRLVLGGIGDSAADPTNTDRNEAFESAIRAAMGGSDDAGAIAMHQRAQATGSSLENYLGALSSRVYTSEEALRAFDLPVLVMTGDQDTDNGSGPALADIIPGARYKQLKGTHQSAVMDPDLPANIIEFLNEGR